MSEALTQAQAALRAASPASRTQGVRLHILCPNCQQPAKASHKRQLSRLVTELAYNCQNPVCGGAFVFVGEAHRWLRLPASPDPEIRLPISPLVQRRALLEMLRTLPDAAMPARGEITGAARRLEPTVPPEVLDHCGHWSHLFAGVRHGA